MQFMNKSRETCHCDYLTLLVCFEIFQVIPSFSSTSLFSIISSLLSDNLTARDPHTDSEYKEGVCIINSLSPPVCLGRYKAKLSQLNSLLQEIWRHASLMHTDNVRYD